MTIGAGRIGAIDGLRGVSILLVMAGHSLGSGRMPEWIGAGAAWLPGAQAGVRMFFVISGFIITHLLLNEERRSGGIRLGRFWVRRALRLLPALILYVGVVGAFVGLGLVSGVGRREFISALTFTTGMWEDGTWALGHTWSLAVEQQFYLLWPVMLALCQGVGRLWLCAALVLLGPMARAACYWQLTPAQVPLWFPCEMDCLMWGCGLALLQFEGGSFIPRICYGAPAVWVFIAVPLIWIPGLMACRPSMAPFSVPFGASCQAAGSLILIGIALGGNSAFGALLSLAPLRAIGLISYSLYLWQQPFLQNYYHSLAFPFPLDWAVACAVAAASYWWVERTFLELKDRRFGVFSGKGDNPSFAPGSSNPQGGKRFSSLR